MFDNGIISTIFFYDFHPVFFFLPPSKFTESILDRYGHDAIPRSNYLLNIIQKMEVRGPELVLFQYALQAVDVSIVIQFFVFTGYSSFSE